jgi:sugar phosphate permease
MTNRIQARWARVAVMMFLVYLIAFIDRNNISMAIPGISKDLGIKPTEAGILLSSFFWGYVITMIPAGYMANKFNAKRLVVTAIVLWGVLSMLTGLVHSFKALIVIRFLMGLVEGVVAPSFYVMISNWFPKNERAKATGSFNSAAAVSSIIMAPLAGWIISVSSWSTMFIVLGLPALVIALAFGVLVGNKPENDKRLSEEERNYIIYEIKNEEKSIPEGGNVLKAIFNSRSILLALTYLGWITGFWSFGSWLPVQMKQLSSAGITGIGFLTAIPFLLALAAMYLNARWSDRSGNRQLFIAIPLFIGGIALICNHFVENIYAHMVCLIIAAIGLYAPFGPWWAWVLDSVPRRNIGEATGFINLVGNMGGIIGPIIVGMIIQGTGNVANGFYIIGFLVLAGGLITYLVRPFNRQTLEINRTVVENNRTDA